MLPSKAQERKEYPIGTGVLDYFKDALAEVAHVSYIGNKQHNGDGPLRWDRSKSTDEADALIRHFVDRGTRDVDGTRHSAKLAWRALALLQKELEADRAQDTSQQSHTQQPHIDAPQSTQPCGCDPGAAWVCEQHRV